MSEELKPCPFCGCEIELRRHEFEGEEPLFAFVCPENSACRSSKNKGHMLFVAEKSELDEAIKLWNTRVPLQKWEPGSEPPEGWYWRNLGHCTGPMWQIVLLKRKPSIHSDFVLHVVGWSADIPWDASRLYGPIPEPEVSE